MCLKLIDLRKTRYLQLYIKANYFIKASFKYNDNNDNNNNNNNNNSNNDEDDDENNNNNNDDDDDDNIYNNNGTLFLYNVYSLPFVMNCLLHLRNQTYSH